MASEAGRGKKTGKLDVSEEPWIDVAREPRHRGDGRNAGVWVKA